ncbi:MAG TPA: sulfite oxidase-like oxidoreductase [Myxococcaceae bacterium]
MSTADDEKERRIVEARLKLRQRYLARMEASPSVADEKPMGSGPPNRHGMPKVPTGQYETDGWPVLDLGQHPKVATAGWSLRVDGAVERPVTLCWEDFMALPQVDDVSDFHCVTTWSRMDVPWRGVAFSTLAALAGPLPSATHVLAHAYDGYTTNLPIEEALKDDVLLVHTSDGGPLPREHGGPVRMITPQLYAWKGAKWIKQITFSADDRPGFWEVRGYSNTAYPWFNDRYSRR